MKVHNNQDHRPEPLVTVGCSALLWRMNVKEKGGDVSELFIN